MMDLFSAATAAKAVGGAWFVKEIFAFFLKLRKQDRASEQRFYRPEEEWKKYCVQKFESISNKVNEIYTAQKVMEVKVNHLEKTIKGLMK